MPKKKQTRLSMKLLYELARDFEREAELAPTTPHYAYLDLFLFKVEMHLNPTRYTTKSTEPQA